MATTIANIKTNLQTRALALLTAYSKHSYSVDVTKNKFRGNSKQLSVLPSGGSEVDSLVGAITMDHSFVYTYTNSYSAGAKSQLGDTLQAQRIQELMDDVLAAYTDARLNKSAIDSTVLLISNLEISEPEFDDIEKIITVKATITVKYKTNV